MPARSGCATTRANRASSRACYPGATAASAEFIEAVWRDGGRFDGWSEHFSFERWARSAAQVFGVLNAQHGWDLSLDWYTTRERARDEVLPWDHIDSGLDKDWLWDDWQAALAEEEQPDCRWTPCFDCGVCGELNTAIQIGPTGATLLPLTVLTSGKSALLERG